MNVNSTINRSHSIVLCRLDKGWQTLETLPFSSFISISLTPEAEDFFFPICGYW